MRKNVSKFVAAITMMATLVLLAMALVACNGLFHKHSYSEEWKWDDTYHWHEATCEHTEEVGGKAKHNITWGEIITPATCETAGVQAGACACGYTTTRPIPAGHDFDTEWLFDSTQHWHKCSRCDEIDEKVGHTFDGNGECSVCGYGLAVSSDDFDFQKKDGKWVVTGYHGKSSELIIPSQYDGVEVVAIGDGAFYDRSDITAITIPQSIKYVGDLAFDGCEFVTKVTYLGDLKGWCEIEYKDYSSNPLYMASEQKTKLYVAGKEVTGDIEIPQGTKKITDVAFCGLDITSVIIPDSVETIGGLAFYLCGSLTEITIPNSVTSIGYGAFYACMSLDKISMSENVTYIGCSVFSCTSFDDSLPNGVTYLGKTLYKYKGEAPKDGNIEIRPGTTQICSGAFQGCESLTSVTIPISVTDIGMYAFQYCVNLQQVVLPDNVTNIGEYAFDECTGLQYVVIPKSVTNIGDKAFAECTGLKVIYYEGDIEQWAHIAKGEYWDAGTSYIMQYNSTGPAQEHVEHLFDADGECVECGYIKETPADDFDFEEIDGKWVVTGYHGSARKISIPAQYNGVDVVGIGDEAFYNRTDIKAVFIPDSVTSIGRSAFGKCTEMETVNIPVGCKVIGESAFGNCQSLRKITISDGIETIGLGAFGFCTGLDEVTVPRSVNYIGSSLYPGMFLGCQIARMNYLGDLKDWCEVGADLYGDHRDFLIWKLSIASLYIDNKEVTDAIEIPQGTTKIGNYAFAGLTGITSVFMPNSVTSIGDRAFQGCTSLSNISISNSVTSIVGPSAFEDTPFENNLSDGLIYFNTILYKYKGAAPKDGKIEIRPDTTQICWGAFDNCEWLTTITIPESVTNISGALSGCTNLQVINWNAVNCTTDKVALPDSVVEVNIGKNVKCIPQSAFFRADHDLNKINYLGDLKSWCEIEFGFYWHVVLDSDSVGAKLYVDGKEIAEDVEIPEGTSHIGDWAFSSFIDITSVTIPNSVENIGENAFLGCTGLKDVYYAGNAEQWKEINQDKSWWKEDGITMHYIYAGAEAASEEVTAAGAAVNEVAAPKSKKPRLWAKEERVVQQ